MNRGSLGSERSKPPPSPVERAPADPSGGRLGPYLRRLREGYGYTLRKVEERAQALGESIDNSQLSRFEKGKAVPSFEKLRALARIFNVPVQNFSDVFDLEEFEPFKPVTGTYEELLRDGRSWFERGEYGRAFVTYERALERAEEQDREGSAGRAERTAAARWRMATALKALGNLAMAEHELREILRRREHLTASTRMRTLLQLAYLYRERGDLFLASVLARECLELARSLGDAATAAGVWNMLGNIAHDELRHDDAMVAYREALGLLERNGEREEMRVTLLINVGGCTVAAGQFEKGVRTLREAHATAVRRGFRRAAALALTRLGESYLERGERDEALRYLTESDRLATRPRESYHDILFLNAYRRWQVAVEEGRGTREKIAFGRLRHLRSLLQRQFPEVDAFDRHVERTRRHA
jgi:transcriptional regulator with XRE-family HTH domain